MSDEQEQRIALAMRSSGGSAITVTCAESTKDSLQYCAGLASALKGAGIVVDGPHTVGMYPTVPYESAVSFVISQDRKLNADALNAAMVSAGALGEAARMYEDGPAGTFEVVVRPNR